jgi:hypothetical protein
METLEETVKARARRFREGVARQRQVLHMSGQVLLDDIARPTSGQALAACMTVIRTVSWDNLVLTATKSKIERPS